MRVLAELLIVILFFSCKLNASAYDAEKPNLDKVAEEAI